MIHRYYNEDFKEYNRDDEGVWLVRLSTGGTYYLAEGDEEPIYIPF